MTIARLALSVAAASVLLAGCGEPAPDLGYVRAVLKGSQNPLAVMTDADLERMGQLVCSDPENPGIGTTAAGMQAGWPGLTDLEAIQVASLLQDQYCPAS